MKFIQPTLLTIFISFISSMPLHAMEMDPNYQEQAKPRSLTDTTPEVWNYIIPHSDNYRWIDILARRIELTDENCERMIERLLNRAALFKGTKKIGNKRKQEIYFTAPFESDYDQVEIVFPHAKDLSYLFRNYLPVNRLGMTKAFEKLASLPPTQTTSDLVRTDQESFFSRIFHRVKSIYSYTYPDILPWHLNDAIKDDSYFFIKPREWNSVKNEPHLLFDKHALKKLTKKERFILKMILQKYKFLNEQLIEQCFYHAPLVDTIRRQTIPALVFAAWLGFDYVPVSDDPEIDQKVRQNLAAMLLGISGIASCCCYIGDDSHPNLRGQFERTHEKLEDLLHHLNTIEIAEK